MDRKRKMDHRILSLLIPVILENALLTLSTMILTGYIGRLALVEINGYGISRRIYGIYYSVFKGLAVGAMMAIARRFGMGDTKKCASLHKSSYILILPFSVFTAVLVWIFARPLLTMMTADAQLLDQGARYLRMTSPFYPLIAMVHLNAAAFQANGNTKTPMAIAAFGNLITITLGYVLIFGIGPIKGLGITGAAWGQNISFLMMAASGLLLLYGRHGLFAHAGTGGLSLPKKDEMKEILSAGIPASLEDSFWQLATVLISHVILSYGQEYYAAYQLGLEGEGFCNMMSAGFMTAAMSLSSNAIGGNDEEAYRLSFGRMHRICLVISAITMTFLLLFSRTVLTLLTDKPGLIVIGSGYLLTMFFSQYPQHMKQVVAGFIRASGHSRTSMFVNLIGLWMVRVPLVVLFGTVWKLPIVWIWWSFNIDQWVRLLLASAAFRKFGAMPHLKPEASLT